MSTLAAIRAAELQIAGAVLSRAGLAHLGIDYERIRAQLAAHRWQRCGLAIVLHNGPLSAQQRWSSALINVGPRSMLAAFTAAQYLGLRGWERDEIHVLAAVGVAKPVVPALPIRLHRSRYWAPVSDRIALRCQAPAAAAVLAAGTFKSARPACGILAAVVQQRLTQPADLERVLVRSTRLRHRAALLAAVHDIAGGSDALSEIDFVRLCRRHQLPEPVQQLRRRDSAGRNRYLDASWRRRDGRLVVAEVDGALHLSPRRWWDDQLRQNELMISGAVVLRFPSVVVRTEECTVAAQLRRALWL